jgi:VanZ family protein
MVAIPNEAPSPRSDQATSGRKFTKYWLPVIIYAIIIFHLSSLPSEDIPALFNYQDVVFHILEYAVLAFLANRAMKAYYPQQPYRRRFLVVFFFCVIYALSDEFHQAFVPTRHPSLADVVYDSLGICIASILYR